MRKLSLTLLMFSMLFVMTGCGQEQADAEAGLTITKEGRITSVLVDSFEKDYYDVEELREMVQLEVSQYNQKAGKQAIELQSLELHGENCVAVLNYQSAEDYALYNEVPFFAGTVKEAAKAGVDLSVTLKEAGKDASIGRAEVEAMKDYYLVVWYGDMPVVTPGKIRYYGDNLQILGSKKIVAADSKAQEDKAQNGMKETEEPAGPFYLLYK